MKEKISFDIKEDFHHMIRVFQGVEEIERIFGIEFAAGVYDGEIIFASDFLDTFQEDAFLEKYDGCVVENIFRINTTRKIVNLNEILCYAEVIHDAFYMYSGSDQFSSPKFKLKKLKGI